MATGAPGTNGVWQYGEDDSEATFSALLNKVASTADSSIGTDRGRLTALEAAGRVKKVYSTAKKDAYFTTATTPTGITGLSVSITPSSASSKILIIAQVATSFDANESFIRLSGGNSSSYIGDASGVQTRAVANASESTVANRTTTQTIVYLDSPATTSSVTYEVQGWVLSGGGLRINYTVANLNTTSYSRGTSSITVMEIAG